MTEEEKRIVKKLQAIINNTPYPGEKATALNVLKKYCLKHGITEEQLETEEEKVFSYDIMDKSGFIAVMFRPIAFWVTKRHRKPWDEEKIKCYTYRSRSKKSIRNIEIKTTPEIFLEIISEFEVYARAYKKQINKYLRDKRMEFTRAFLDAHNLLIPCDDVEPKRIGKENWADDIKRFYESAAYMETLNKVKHVAVYKQIGTNRGGKKDIKKR